MGSFLEKHKHHMCPAIIDNVLKILSCGLTVQPEMLTPEESLLQLQEQVLPYTGWQHITFTLNSSVEI